MEQVYPQLNLEIIAKKNPFTGRLGKKEFCVKSGIYGYEGFETQKKLDAWLSRLGLKAILVDEIKDENKEYALFTIEGQIVERLFWDLSEIPVNADMFVGRSNGTEVHCFSLKTDFGAIVWRPNPNAKQVYRKFSLQEYAKFKRGAFSK